MKWTDQLFIFGMAGLVLVARVYGIDGVFLAFVGTWAGFGIGFRFAKMAVGDGSAPA